MEILIFYLSICAQMLFLLISRCFSFKTIRERHSLGANMRNRKDFLEFVKDDIHYLIICLIEFMLYIYMYFHQSKVRRAESTGSKALILLHLAFQYLLLFWVYFKKNQEKRKVVPYIFAYIILTVGLIIFLFWPGYRDVYYWWPYCTHYAFI